MKIILINILLANIIWQFLLLIWDCLHGTRGEEMIIGGYQRENMFRDLNRNLNSIQIPTPVDTNESSTKQIVYKIDGNFNGNIKGDNVTVILMGDGSINGDIESEEGNVVLIKGNINGSVKANKIISPENQSTHKASYESFYRTPSYLEQIQKKEESEISNYMSVRPINIKCPNCNQYINKNIRIDISTANDKIFHTMVTPLDNNY